MASNQSSQHALLSSAQEKIQEDFDFKDDILNRKSLTSCLPFLYECMTVEEVVVRLQANNILTAHQADSIRAEKTAFEKNQKMIDFVQKRGPEAFSCFMKSLTETGQKYIFDKLIEERKTIAERENLSKLAMWSTKLQISANQKFNLESLITEEELGQLKNIRVKELPEQIGQIGKGAYGKVLLFKFEDGSLRAGKKPKINLDNKSAEESQLKRYLSYALCEIKILHQLDHERIIKFFGFYLDQSQMIIFMDVMRGSVKDEINEKGYLSEVKAMNYFIQATEGLVYLHSRRPAIVHRDIKCENLLLTMEYNVKLADFGLASNLIIDNGSKTNLSTAPKSFVGTHLFHAPEIIQTVNKPEAYGRKSDIWSLACALVQMISGEPPYRNLSLIELIQRSAATSQNPLKYSGDILLPTASNEMKKLLNSMFTADYKLRPSAEHVLSLALDVARTFSNDQDNGYKLKGDNQQRSLHSISKCLQNIKVNNQTTGVAEESVEVIHNVRNKENRYIQSISFNRGGHEGNYCPITESKEVSNSRSKEAEQRGSEAQSKLDDAYSIKQGMPKSTEEAVKWYTKLAEQGNADAQNNLGNIYRRGKGVPQSDEEAVKWYWISAEQGYADAQCNLGNMYEKGSGVPQSDEEAVKWYRKSAEQGNADAQNNLGYMYQNGRGVNQSDEEAVLWYTIAAIEGNAGGQYNLGFMYRDGRGMPQSNEEAVIWYTKSAEQGYADAQLYLGEMYADGRGVPQSDYEALKWYRNSAEQGNVIAQCTLGNIYKKGKGMPQSNEEAVKWYRKAAEQEHGEAQLHLAWMYLNGKGVQKSDEKAVQWCIKSAECGHVDAQLHLGLMYEKGVGVPPSDENAVKWLRKAAEQGDAIAQGGLGYMYREGMGVLQSDEEAVKWYRKAAEQGDVYAQCGLGSMYKKGKGVPQSDKEAVKWYRKAAEQGDANAQEKLGDMYKKGRGVPQSDVEADKWYRKEDEGDANEPMKYREISERLRAFESWSEN